MLSAVMDRLPLMSLLWVLLILLGARCRGCHRTTANAADQSCDCKCGEEGDAFCHGSGPMEWSD